LYQLTIDTQNKITLNHDNNVKFKGVSFYWVNEKTEVFNINDYYVINITELNISDALGNGKMIVLKLDNNFSQLEWSFTLYEKLVTVALIVYGEGVAVAKICPFYTEDYESVVNEARVLRVPFDNDKWVRCESHSIETSKISYMVGSIYDNNTNNCIVAGALTHNIWKTAVDIKSDSFEIYGGIADEETRDTIPHGIVRNNSVNSPLVCILFATDWRDGLTEFGLSCSALRSKMIWNGDIPYGWNSWAAYKATITYEKYIKASEFIKNLDNFEHNGTAYVNFDSFWSNLSQQQLHSAVNFAHENGQRSGIYFAPFTGWVTDVEQQVEDYENIKWKDIILKDKNGELLLPFDGAYPLDVTHPTVLQICKTKIAYFKQMGFKYINLDFLGHGAVEGYYYDKNIQTGMQAYNFAMSYITDLITEADMFISLSIAPLFPHGYGHSRRICCDVFGNIEDSEYLLNALTYGFWQNKTIYEFTDPDHLCFCERYEGARMRYISGVISGTMMLLSNDVEDVSIKTITDELLSKKEILQIAKWHKAFRPVRSGCGDKSTDVFYLKNDILYLAIFNFEDKLVDKIVNLKDLGYTDDKYIVEDMWTNTKVISDNKITYAMQSYLSTILKVSPC